MENFEIVELQKAYRLLNTGATGLISAAFDGDEDIMPASWIRPLDLVPFKATLVMDARHYTRPLIEKSGFFAISLPTVSIAKETLKLGSTSKFDVANKVELSGIETFKAEGFDMPLVKGACAWMIFKVIPEEHNQKAYDLFIGECVAAWADPRVFKNGHFCFEQAPRTLSTLHYTAGGHFYTMGEAIEVSL